ncbi:MAG: 3-deoxy-7-phosphoheptulonate synthase [Candidatus Aenigmatarchaeota archaeon]|nr:MAG: 3-deoxy-7-phosphoheptulonate synthase [Candidatus Aenigmarchaeota archaeon]
MVVVMKRDASKEELNRVIRYIKSYCPDSFVSVGDERIVINIIGDERKIDFDMLSGMEGVEKAIPILKPYKLASREYKQEDTVIKVGGIEIGGKEPVFIAGPCSIESEYQIMRIAEEVKEAGAHILRGGAFKPRTSPYSFCGLGMYGVELLAKAGEEFDMPVITEVMDPGDAIAISEYADILQVGARNMKNYSLLRKLAEIKKPVLLKRGEAAKIDEWLMAAEYMLLGKNGEGNEDVILCERGIRTFEDYTRNTFDIVAISVAKAESHLPVIADPSHATGKRELVYSASIAAIAAGADGLMIEVHYDPDKAYSDGAQSITPRQLKEVISKSKEIYHAVR